MTHDSYVSPLSTRYASLEMQHIFSDDFKFRTWRRLWIALARAEMELGLPITQGQIDEMEREKDHINYDLAQQKEKELRHAERMLPELGRQTFTEMVRLKGYMVYDAEQLADKCGMEYGSFRRKVKKMTGYTAKEWVIKERAKDVEHYLKNTNLTLTEVAFTTGFASTSNLNDFCKAYLLDTPGEIRRKAHETIKCTVTRT